MLYAVSVACQRADKKRPGVMHIFHDGFAVRARSNAEALGMGWQVAMGLFPSDRRFHAHHVTVRKAEGDSVVVDPTTATITATAEDD